MLLIAGGSCQKIADLLNFTISDSTNFTIPATGILIGTALNLPGIPVSSNSSSTYAGNNTTASLVQNVTLNKLSLTTVDPASQNFDFLKSISLYIASDASGSDKVLLASLDPVPTGQTTINLTPGGNKLDKYLSTGNYTLFTSAVLAKALPQDTKVRADSQFNVQANVK
ncbi:hypothetical protein [Hymenobacter sp. BRD67]|uniref:hypothetical protein n=1 Tax=Hymenobacter sp. BRD67 TaxID=2675877 RepID=UPI0015630D81|nr:hypothetical protein [Hymenobacter sp. BRD67]QKG52886.1 hypothetical protein GKZ67_10080 [Hymenobacter sp. BRD67]